MTEIRWPQGIPKPLRLPLDTGHRSFCLHRTHLGGFHRQPITLTGHLIVMVAAGSVLVERGDERLVANTGDAAIVTAGRTEITEIPVPQGRHGEVFYHFFNTPVLRDTLLQPVIEEVALNMHPLPGSLGLARQGLQYFLPSLRQSGARFPYHFSKSLRGLIHQNSAAMFSFLAKEYFLPKLRLNLLMEQQVLGARRPDVPYPGGAAELKRDLRNYLGLSAEAWWKKRRAQLTQLWLAHRAAPEAVAQRFGYPAFPDLRQDLFGDRMCGNQRAHWRDLEAEERRALSIPAWLPLPRLEYPEITPAWYKAENPLPVEPGCGEEADDCWSATSTIDPVGKLIRFHYGDASPAAEMLHEFESLAA